MALQRKPLTRRICTALAKSVRVTDFDPFVLGGYWRLVAMLER